MYFFLDYCRCITFFPLWLLCFINTTIKRYGTAMRHPRHNLRHHQSDATTTGSLQEGGILICFCACFSGTVISITVNVTAQVTRFYILCASFGGQPHFFCLLTGLGKTTQMHYSWQNIVTRPRLGQKHTNAYKAKGWMGGRHLSSLISPRKEVRGGQELELVWDSDISCWLCWSELNVSMPCHRIRKMEEEYDWRIEGVGRMNNILRKNLQKG